MKTITDRIHSIVMDASKSIGIDDPVFKIESPKISSHGDFSCNVALTLAKKIGRSPRDIATEFIDSINNLHGRFFDRIEIAGPGFINMFLSEKIITQELALILEKGHDYGKHNLGKDKAALVEFVSANPTGPLTVGHGRGAIIGDTISNILSFNGYSVEREYYFNNAGKQMNLLALSVHARYLGILGIDAEIPEGGYEGEYIKDIAQKVVDTDSEKYVDNIDTDVFKSVAEDEIFDDIKITLGAMGISFDSFFNEHELYKDKSIFKVVEMLKDKGLIYDKDGATWFKLTDLGKEADRVLIKSSGEPTYRLPDIAYHVTKFERGYDLIIDVFGADHMDAYPDVISALSELGYDESIIDVVIHQFVTIVKDGKPAKMSTRKANFITIDQLIDEIGIDVLRYFFLMRGVNTHLQFDIDLARSQTDENPVFYIQYAHARICNMLARYESLDSNDIGKAPKMQLLSTDAERELIIKLISFPDLVRNLSRTLEPQTLANYVHDIASSFHKYYAKHKIITEDKDLTLARTSLSSATATILKTCLDILGISSPERM